MIRIHITIHTQIRDLSIFFHTWVCLYFAKNVQKVPLTIYSKKWRLAILANLNAAVLNHYYLLIIIIIIKCVFLKRRLGHGGMLIVCKSLFRWFWFTKLHSSKKMSLQCNWGQLSHTFTKNTTKQNIISYGASLPHQMHQSATTQSFPQMHFCVYWSQIYNAQSLHIFNNEMTECMSEEWTSIHVAQH